MGHVQWKPSTRGVGADGRLGARIPGLPFGFSTLPKTAPQPGGPQPAGRRQDPNIRRGTMTVTFEVIASGGPNAKPGTPTFGSGTVVMSGTLHPPAGTDLNHLAQSLCSNPNVKGYAQQTGAKMSVRVMHTDIYGNVSQWSASCGYGGKLKIPPHSAPEPTCWEKVKADCTSLYPNNPYMQKLCMTKGAQKCGGGTKASVSGPDDIMAPFVPQTQPAGFRWVSGPSGQLGEACPYPVTRWFPEVCPDWDKAPDAQKAEIKAAAQAKEKEFNSQVATYKNRPGACDATVPGYLAGALKEKLIQSGVDPAILDPAEDIFGDKELKAWIAKFGHAPTQQEAKDAVGTVWFNKQPINLDTFCKSVTLPTAPITGPGPVPPPPPPEKKTSSKGPNWGVLALAVVAAVGISMAAGEA